MVPSGLHPSVQSGHKPRDCPSSPLWVSFVSLTSLTLYQKPFITLANVFPPVLFSNRQLQTKKNPQRQRNGSSPFRFHGANKGSVRERAVNVHLYKVWDYTTITAFNLPFIIALTQMKCHVLLGEILNLKPGNQLTSVSCHFLLVFYWWWQLLFSLQVLMLRHQSNLTKDLWKFAPTSVVHRKPLEHCQF